MKRFLVLSWLPCAVLACAGGNDADPADQTIAKRGTVERAVPVANVAARDSRPLLAQQSSFLVQAFDAELAALELESTLVKDDPAQRTERGPRILADRTALSGLRQLAATDASSERPPVRQLEAYDRFVRDMARDRLRGNAYTLGLIEPWVETNQKFLESKALADRDLAIQARMVAFQSLIGGVPLRQAIISIDFASMKATERSDLFGRLKTAFPDAPLPVVTAKMAEETTEIPISALALSSASVPSGPGTSSASSGPTLPATLPRLDGSATPLGEIAPSAVPTPKANTTAAPTELVKKIYVPIGTIAKQKSAANAGKSPVPPKPKQPQKPPR